MDVKAAHKYVDEINPRSPFHQSSDPISTKKYSQAISLFVHWGSVHLKALCKMLVKSTQGDKNRTDLKPSLSFNLSLSLTTNKHIHKHTHSLWYKQWTIGLLLLL